MPAPPLSVRGVYETLRVPTLRDLVFSTKAYLAVTLALMIGFSQNLENPYWAVLTIYIVLTPPETGAIRSKTLFRFIGTIGGGTLMMAVTGLFGDQLGVLLAATIAIITVTTFLRQVDRTPTNYLWFSGGLTAGVVGLTNLMQPTNVFSYATARMGEISLGILAITAVDSLLWPRAMTPDFLATMADWRKKVDAWVTDALGPVGELSADSDRRSQARQQLRDLANAVGVIDAKAIQLPFDVVAVTPRGRHLNLVRRQVVALIADLAGIEIWARTLRGDSILHTNLAEPLERVTTWIEGKDGRSDVSADQQAASGEILIDDLTAIRAALDPASGGLTLIQRGLITRLIAFVRDRSDLLLALSAIETGRRPAPRLEAMARAAKPVRSADYLGAIFDVAPVALSIVFTSAVWYFTAWSSGSGALLFSFIGCAFIIGQGQVLQSSSGLVLWILCAFAIVLLYQFAILPRVTDFPVLIAVFGCVLLPLGLLMTMSMAGMLICVFTFAFLGLQNAYSGDFSQSLQSLSGSLAGLLIAASSLYLCTYDRARFAVRRLVNAVREDILDIAVSRRLPDRQRFLFLTIDRLALYFPAAEQLAQRAPIPRLRMIDDLAIGANLLTLREERPSVTASVQTTIDMIRAEIGHLYRRTRAEQADVGVLLQLTATARDEAAARGEPVYDRLLEALTGMHLALTDAWSPPPGGPVAI